MDMLTVADAIRKLQAIVKAHPDNASLFLQTRTPCGQTALVSDLKIGPADYGFLVDVVNGT